MSVPRKLARNTLLTLLGRFGFIAVSILLTPLALARMGREAFGFWSILQFLGGSFALLDLGLSTATTRYAAQLGALDAWDAIASTVRRALVMCAVSGAAIAGIGILLTPVVLAAFDVPPEWRRQAEIAYALAFACLALTTVVGVLQGALNGLQRMDLTNGIGLALIPLLALVTVVALNSKAPLAWVMAAQAAHVAVAAAVLAFVLGRVVALGRGGRPSKDTRALAPRLMEMIRFGTKVQVAMVASLLHVQVDKILLGTMVGLSWVAPYELGLRLANGIGSLPQVFLYALMPALADIDTRKAGANRAELYLAVLEPYMLLLVPLCAAAAVLADPLLQLWLGETKPDAVLAMRMLVAATGFTLLSGVAATLARAGGRPGLEARFGIIALAIHVPLSLLGLRLMGWQGTLVGGAVASLVASVWLLRASGKWMGLPWLAAPLRTIAMAGGPSVLASLAAWLVVRAWPAPLGRLQTLPVLGSGALTFALVYVTVVVVVFPDPARRFGARLRSTLPSLGGQGGGDLSGREG